MIQVQRIYEFENKSSQENNSIRILVDRLWPRGISKEKVNMIYGQKILLHQLNLENGSIMMKVNLLSSKKNILKNLILMIMP